MRIERRGKIEPGMPRFTKFLVDALGGHPLDDVQAPTDRRIDGPAYGDRPAHRAQS